MKNFETIQSTTQQPENAKKEELARTRMTEIQKLLDENKFYRVPAVLFKETTDKDLDPVVVETINELLPGLISQRLAKLAETKQSQAFVDAIYWFGSRLKVADIPSQVFDNAEIFDLVQDHIESWFNTHAKNPQTVADEIEKFSRLGLISREVVSGPEMRAIADKALIESFDNSPGSAGGYASLRDFYVEKLGIGSVGEYNSLPEIQSAIKKSLTTAYRSSPQEFSVRRDSFIAKGIATADEIDALGIGEPRK